MDLRSSVAVKHVDIFTRLTQAYSFQSRSFREAKEEMKRFHSSMFRKLCLTAAIAQFLVAHPSSSARDVGGMVQEITSVKFRYALPLQALNQILSLADWITYCQDGLGWFSNLRSIFSAARRPVPVNVLILRGCGLGLSILKLASGKGVQTMILTMSVNKSCTSIDIFSCGPDGAEV